MAAFAGYSMKLSNLFLFIQNRCLIFSLGIHSVFLYSLLFAFLGRRPRDNQCYLWTELNRFWYTAISTVEVITDQPLFRFCFYNGLSLIRIPLNDPNWKKRFFKSVIFPWKLLLRWFYIMQNVAWNVNCTEVIPKDSFLNCLFRLIFQSVMSRNGQTHFKSLYQLLQDF